MTNSYNKRILKVLTYVHDNPGEDLSLDQLADVAAMSRFHWHRVFRAITGETCAEAVRRVRMYRAGKWLLNTTWSISKIARRVGYANERSFAHAFKTEMSVTPNSFRKSGVLEGSLVRTPRGKFKMYSVETKELPERRVAALLHVGPYEEIGECFEKLSQSATDHGLWPSSEGMVGVHYDDPNMVDKAKLRAHAGLMDAGGMNIPEDLEELNLPSGLHAVLTYKGAYASIKVAYDFLFGSWLPSSGFEPANAPCYELYLNSPDEVPEEELITEICLPLQT